MKTMKNSWTYNQPLKVVIILFAVGMMISSYAQKPGNLPIKNYAVGNLVNALNSDNDGLRKSAIYLAGKHKIREVVDALTVRLSREKDAGTKILIALSLYNIGDPRGMDFVQIASKTDPDLRVRRMCDAIFTEYLQDNSQNSAELLDEF